ncbi:MAG: hypothetical protein ACRYFK_02225 [Janthinobacterium lividum]
MYPLLTTLCLAAHLTASRPTQGPDVLYPKAIQERATTLTQVLAHRIHFNEGQYLRVKQLHLRYLNERQELELSMAGAPTADRDSQLAAAQLRYEQELNDLLHPSQRLAYRQLRANLTAHQL